QAVPAGSHVRLNLQTGEREAKLPERENGEGDGRGERRRKRLGKVDVDSSSFTSQELKKALAKMKESEKAERKVSKESSLFLRQCTVQGCEHPVLHISE
ncbi:SIL1 factor, partial [Alcedo cyanopectus]|nr:SIL1 factor [Ceyx cyanopectus]